jgi:chemotaxis protein histidine kinase CheA
VLDKDILTGFQDESRTLLEELEGVVERLEEETEKFPSTELEQFAQRIDRIMGAAQTLNQIDPGHLGLQRIGAIARLCKTLGYKAAEFKLSVLIPIYAAFWADTLEVLSELVDNVDNEAKSQALADAFSSTVQNRLKWLSDKVQQLSGTKAAETMNQSQVDDILAHLKKK